MNGVLIIAVVLVVIVIVVVLKEAFGTESKFDKD